MLIALTVVDDRAYARYRQEIAPILASHGATFRYDFRVSEVLVGEGEQHVNRAFVLSFPDPTSKQGFWTDPRLLAPRVELFEPSVRTFTIIAEYER
ncbi:MAG TPA: DUF1330 domain-containing protein [Polyangiaceae bacterium]|nr:DUF1330 domain-containing protein [Polyangiaceae bacterium]